MTSMRDRCQEQDSLELYRALSTEAGIRSRALANLILGVDYYDPHSVKLVGQLKVVMHSDASAAIGAIKKGMSKSMGYLKRKFSRT